MKRGEAEPPPAGNTGAAEESRTLDLNLGKVALYQLSYCRTEAANYSCFPPSGSTLPSPGGPCGFMAAFR
jgi:hypothetical protein